MPCRRPGEQIRPLEAERVHNDAAADHLVGERAVIIVADVGVGAGAIVPLRDKSHEADGDGHDVIQPELTLNRT
jgi:hypothetical protein